MGYSRKREGIAYLNFYDVALTSIDLEKHQVESTSPLDGSQDGYDLGEVRKHVVLRSIYIDEIFQASNGYIHTSTGFMGIKISFYLFNKSE